MQLVPYLMFNGQCEEVLNFYAKALNGEIKNLSRYEGSPAESMSADKQKILHSNFEANGIFFMASDSGQQGSDGNSNMIHLSLDFDTTEEQDKVFNALSEGAKINMPL